ncbi:hypothetical protein SAMN05216436_108137 [bacterium A37T11]|nr:hypothetical protein SAMN05216436_108137 [bacterium A37T11]
MNDFIYEEFKERVQNFGIDIGPEDPDGNVCVNTLLNQFFSFPEAQLALVQAEFRF